MNLLNRAHDALIQGAPLGDPILSAALPAAALVLWAVVMRTALQQRGRRLWVPQAPAALLVGAGAGLAAWLLLPPGPTPGLAEFGYVLPPARLAQTAGGFGLASAAFAWPLLVLRRARRRAGPMLRT